MPIDSPEVEEIVARCCPDCCEHCYATATEVMALYAGEYMRGKAEGEAALATVTGERDEAIGANILNRNALAHAQASDRASAELLARMSVEWETAIAKKLERVRALEEALREMLASAMPHPVEHTAMYAAWTKARRLVSPASPASAEGAAAGTMPVDIVHALRVLLRHTMGDSNSTEDLDAAIATAEKIVEGAAAGKEADPDEMLIVCVACRKTRSAITPRCSCGAFSWRMPGDADEGRRADLARPVSRGK